MTTSPENSPQPPELREVTLDHGTWENFEYYVGNRDEVSSEMLVGRSQINEDLRKADGSPITEEESIAILEALQEKGKVSLKADQETGMFRVLGERKDLKDPTPEEEKRRSFLGRFASNRVLSKLDAINYEIGYNAHYYRESATESGKQVREKGKHLGKMVSGQARAEREAVAAEQQERAQWEARRQTKLILRTPETGRSNADQMRRDTVEAQFDPIMMQRLQYLSDAVQEELDEARAQRRRAGEPRLTMEENDEEVERITSEVITHFLDDKYTEKEEARYKALMTWFATSHARNTRRR